MRIADANVYGDLPATTELDLALLDFCVLAGGDTTSALAAATAGRHQSGVSYREAETELRAQLHGARYQRFGRERVFVTLANQLNEETLITARIGSGIELSQIEPRTAADSRPPSPSSSSWSPSTSTRTRSPASPT